MNADLGYIIFFAVAIGAAVILFMIWVYLHRFPRAKKARNFFEKLGDSIIDNIPVA